MKPDDLTAFTSIMDFLGQMFTGLPNEKIINVWFEWLKGFDIVDIKRAAKETAEQRKYQTFPTFAEFYERVTGRAGAVGVDAMADWQAVQVKKAVKEIGYFWTVVFDDSVTHAVIRDVYNGWPKLCEYVNREDRPWFLRDFATHYKHLHECGQRAHGRLPGEAESVGVMENGKHVRFDPERHIRMIGNPEKCSEILALGAPCQQERIPANVTALLAGIGG